MRKFIPQMEPWFDKKETLAVLDYMQSGGWITEFTKTEDLEAQLSHFIGAQYCVMTVNGTVSLILALLALGIKAGDEVLVPDLTMIATANAPVLIGVKPIFVDVEPNTLCMDLSQAQQFITQKTKALIYVSLNGRSGDMNKLVRFCKAHKLLLIEDAAQALGSKWHGKHLGSFGSIGCLSFSTQKIITTGQGGALLTNNEKLYRTIKRVKDFGRESGGNDIHNKWGWNFKFTDLQAILGIEQMKKLPRRIKRKKEIYKKYFEALKHVKQIEFIQTNLKDTTPWFVDIYLENPSKLAFYLKEKGIGTRPIYPPIHTQKIYRQKQKGNKFTVTKHYASRGLWLPSSSKLTNAEIDYVINAIKEYYRS